MQSINKPEMGLVAGIGATGVPNPMSFRYVQDTTRNTLYVADNVPTDFFDKNVKVCPVAFVEFCRLSREAAPAIGLPGQRDETHRDIEDYRNVHRQQNGCLMVEPWRVEVAQSRVPEQMETWTCGANSGARFAAMLGSPIVHYHDYMNGMPYYGGWIFPRIGGNPESLQNHLRNASELHGTEIRQICNVRYHSIWEGIIESLRLKRPALALLMDNGTSMHWVTIIGLANQKFWYLDTNGRIYELRESDLHHWMNMGNCAAQKFGFVERFNCVVATGGHTPREG